MLIDSHCHLASHKFDPSELGDIVSRARMLGVQKMVSLATCLDDIEATMAEIVDFLHIGEHGYAAGIGLRDFSPSTEQGNEFFVDAIA